MTPARQAELEQVAREWLMNNGFICEGYGHTIAEQNLAALLASREAAVLEEAAAFAESYSGFTGANYCDIEHPSYNAQQVHDYGRGGNDVRRGLAAMLRQLAQERRP